MSIDWITVLAQIANFLVLVWLLKRFLYRPILDGIDAREAEISNRMGEAVEAKDKAAAVEAEYHEKLRALHVSQAEMSETIRKSAEDQRDALLADAAQQMQAERENWQAHLGDEAQKFTAELHRAGTETLLSLTRKALTDLADETLEERMAHHLAGELGSMGDDLKKAAGDATQATIVSHDALPAHVQDSLKAEVSALFPKAAVVFKTEPAQAPGLMLRLGGAQISWTLDSYIEGLESLMQDRLSTGAVSKVTADAL
ncbi:ATP synthase F0 subcomplex B subunit [Sulfitobacter marinus]|uniref:ATP synthase subunit b n=1 Tax=Sulfitobacter marinus TaxID=394264 RepID=A0A1I6VB90_9RHOB|nr:F0F1 ATP synthase subunit B [Sulfitobacter marinus]SFT11008.1 ATP synthase F0 subcomplex B subunit [Sulfitobacter marinus]